MTEQPATPAEVLYQQYRITKVQIARYRALQRIASLVAVLAAAGVVTLMILGLPRDAAWSVLAAVLSTALSVALRSLRQQATGASQALLMTAAQIDK